MNARAANPGGRWAFGIALLGDAAALYFEDRAKRLSAGLAYYALFALVPTLLLAVGVAAAFVGREAAAGELADQLSGVLGTEAADQLESALASMWTSTNGSSFALFGVLAVVWSSSVLFAAWRDMVEFIWEVPYEPSLESTLRTRAFAVLVPIGAGLLLAVTMLLQSLLTFAAELAGSGLLDATLRTAGAVLQTGIAVLALTVLFRHSARETRPAWHDVWPAVVLVVVVLNVGYWAYGLYLRFIGSSSVTGAASSAVLGLLVVYYTAQMLLFGAELIKVLGRRDMPDGPSGDPETGGESGEL